MSLPCVWRVCVLARVCLQTDRLAVHPHSNVLQCVAPQFRGGPSTLCLPLELCTGGDVMQAVVASGTGLAMPAVASVLRQAAEGLVHCHRSGVFHLDVKPDNLLVTGEGVVKVADFGCSVIAPAGPEDGHQRGHGRSMSCGPTCGVTAMRAVVHSTRQCMGTSVYAAPESLGSRVTGSAYDAGAADVWSLGVSTLVAATGFFPWGQAVVSDKRYAYWANAWEARLMGSDRDDAARVGRLSRVLCQLAGKDLPEGLCRVLVGMLCPSPVGRPSMEEVAMDAWVVGSGCGGSPRAADCGAGAGGAASVGAAAVCQDDAVSRGLCRCQ
jgi:serine/threonine protein kinase